MTTTPGFDPSAEQNICVFPTSFAQQRLWLLDQLEPQSSAYNLLWAVRISIPLDTEALQQSLNKIVERHAALRTIFMAHQGQPMQVILPHLHLPLEVIDLHHLPEAKREAEVQPLASEQAQRPFDLAHGPLLRMALLQPGAQDQVLLLVAHQIIFDGWSVDVFFRELATLYQAFASGQPATLPELPMQYADFARQQREWLQGEKLAEQLAYWKEQLAGTPAALELPTDRPRPAVPTNRGSSYLFQSPKPLSEALKFLSREEGVSLFTILTSVFQTLLYRYTGQDDLLLGMVTADRGEAETEHLIDFFSNTLVLRTDLSGNPTFRELLGRVRLVILEAQAHEIPFEMLVRELQPGRTVGMHPFVQVLLALEPPSPVLPSEWRLARLDVQSETDAFDLALRLAEGPDGLTGHFIYNSDLFDEATIARMAGHWQTLLEGIVADPAQRLSKLPHLTEAERQQLLVEWNDTASDYPKDMCVHQLFEEQVERTPEAVALVFEDEQLTYQELNRRANKLAHALQKLGVGPEILVGVCMERSIEMVVALMGILKAGGAYVPLDPSYPRERVEYMIQDAQLPVLLTQQRLLDILPETKDTVILSLDTQIDWDDVHGEWDVNAVSHVQPDHLVYMIYTSGSTGKPKGVMNIHRSLTNRLWWMQQAYQLTPDDRVMQKTPFSFDVSVWEFFWPLMTGARLVVARPGGHQDPAYLAALIAAQQITTMHFVPSMLQAFLLDPHLEQCKSLKRVICSGEALPVDCQERFFSCFATTELHNLYGPTEAAIDVTSWQCLPGNKDWTVPIGRPIANTQIYILDRAMQPVPIGVTGELYIGGVNVARGYFHRPELTAEKFIHDPFSSEPGMRLFKTGDLARYRADGNIEFLGRIDHQVKIRGFRIELGEIEAVLSVHPAVQQAVVVAREDSPGDKRLVAYVVLHPEQIATLAELRSHVMKQVPSYMVPSAFVLLEALPVTPNGKVDRRALPAPNTNQLKLEENFVLPRTSIEELLADIWAQVLQLHQVGIHNNFFELGGDSILSIQIVARAHQAGLTLTPKHLFQYPTIAQLAAIVTPSQPVEAQQETASGAVPLTPIQHWFFEQQFTAPHHWNQAWLLEMNQALDVALLEQAVQKVLVHHDALRLRFKPEGIGWLQVYADHERAEVFRQIDLSGLLAEEQHAALETIAAEAQASLNFETGPLLRIVYFQMGSNQPARLLIVIHHLVVDGVSWRILLEDLTTAYEHLRQGKVPHLPAKTTSFQRWAQQLKEYAQLTTVRQELPYWLNRASMRTSPLPTDYTDDLEANTMASARTVVITLSPEETEALLHSVPKAYHTQINDVLLTALVQAFAQWTGERTLLVDLEGHGREPLLEEINLVRTVGWFTTIFPVCLVLNDTSPGEALKAIKEQLRHIPNRGIGYGVLRYIGEQEDSERLKALPQAQVKFNYLGQFDQMVSEKGLFKLARESAGPTCNLKETRPYLLDIEGLVIRGQLEVSWQYNEHMHHHDTIERLAEYYLAALRALIAHCQSPDAGGYTPSDFPLAKLNEQELNNLLASLGKSE